MIIGITGKNDLERDIVANYLCNKYKYSYVNLDSLLRDFYKDNNGCWIDSFNVINQLNNLVINLLGDYDKNFNIVVSTALLEKSILFDKCDYIFKTTSNRNFISSNLFEKEMSFLVNTISDYENKFRYNLKINVSGDWMKQLSEYLDFNLFGKEKISVVVPIYNTEHLLVNCVNSIINQSYKNLEIILIDDGSTDHSLELCNLLSMIDNRIKVIHQENKGLSEARNKGIEVASGDYIGFVDSDDFVSFDMFENLLRNIKKYKTDVSGVRAYIHTRDGNIEKFSDKEREIITVSDEHELITSYCDGIISIAVWDKIFKREALEGIKFRKEVFQEDSDFILQLCLAKKTFVCDTK